MAVSRAAMISAVKLRSLAVAVGLGQHPLLEVVVGDLEGGADIGCEGEGRRATFSGNASSAKMAGEQVTDAVASWVKKGFVRGPLDVRDVPAGAKINGLMCRPKPDGGVRVIMNMSAPAGASVNDGIDADRFPAVMSSTGKWLAVLNAAGRECDIMKMDWADAYKHIPVRREDVQLQYFMWLGKAFAELCLVFGTSSSVGIYDRAAKLVLDVAVKISQFPKNWVCQHLDDVCAAAPAGSVALQKFHQTYRNVASQVGVQLAPLSDPDKAFEPCKRGTVLGVCYDTVAWTWEIPRDKLGRFVAQLREMLGREEVKQAEIWSVAGRIMHYAPLIPCGRFNLDHVVAANGISRERDHVVWLWPGLKRQLWFWHTMVVATSGYTRIPDPAAGPPPTVRECYSDAAGGTLEGIGRGVGVVSGEWWAYVPWPRKINCGVKAADGKKLSRKLSALELVGPLLCVAAGHEFCRGRAVRVWVDNIGSVKIWEKGYSLSCGLCNTLVKAISTIAAGIGCRLFVEKITRCSNAGAVMADALSKADFRKFRSVSQSQEVGAAVEPAAVPGQLLAWLANPVEDDQLGPRLLRELAGKGAVLQIG
jgi:hypothetical protein